MSVDSTVLDWLKHNHDRLFSDLAALVKVPSISTDGDHQPQIEQTAALTCEQMRAAGLQNTAVLAHRQFQSLRLRRMARRPGQADGVSLRPSRCSAG